MTGRVALLLGLIAGPLVLGGCGAPREPSSEILVFAAASTIDAVESALAALEEPEGPAVRASFGPTSTLARQIVAGAPADLFLSADREWADHVADRVEVAARVDLVGNALAVIAPAGATSPGAGPTQAADDEPLRRLLAENFERIAVADPEAVPAGIYARQALTSAGLWAALEPRLVPALDVRAALALVERGEVDAGIVYRTDALAAEGVELVGAVDPGLHSPIVYPLLLLDGAAPGARGLFDRLASPEGLDQFLERGFVRLR